MTHATTAIRLAKVLCFLATLTSARAQSYTSDADCGSLGPTVFTTTVAASLALDGNKLVQVPLDSRYTGAGYRWDVTYTMVRTKTDYPWWNTCPRVDVTSARGEVLGRCRTYSFAGTTTDTFAFYGDDNPVVRPSQVRLTFGQINCFPYRVEAQLTARTIKACSSGGPLREKPTYMAVGSAEAPNWMCGDLILTGEGQRFMIFPLRGRQQLRAKVVKPATLRYGELFNFVVYDLNMHQVGTAGGMLWANYTNDYAVYTNPSTSPTFVVVGIQSSTGLLFQRVGFYSPQGACPDSGEVIPEPAQGDVNPYLVAAATSQSSLVPAGGGNATFTIPGTGELTRLRLRMLRTPYLTYSVGMLARVTLKSQTGVILKQQTYSVSYFEPIEFVLDLDATTNPATSPGTVEVSTSYDGGTLDLEASRYSRTRP